MQAQQKTGPSQKSAAVRYGLAVLMSALALFLTFWIRTFADTETFDLFHGVVFLSALYGGLGPALLAAFLSIVACDYFFIPPLLHFSYSNTCFVLLAVFATVALITSSLSA